MTPQAPSTSPPHLDASPWVSAFRLLLFALLALLPLSSLAADAEMTYSLSFQGQVVGKRDVTLRYLAGERGEILLLDAWTEFSVAMATPLSSGNYSFEQRLGGRFGGNRSFAASLRDNGETREVQGFLAPDGRWVVTVIDRSGARTWFLDHNEVDLTSMELMEPERALRIFESVQTLRVLVAESGTVLQGSVTPLGEETVTIGAATATVKRFRWSTSVGDMVFSYDDEGHLMDYQMVVVGKLVQARLTQLPAPRDFGDALQAPLMGGAIQEEAL